MVDLYVEIKESAKVFAFILHCISNSHSQCLSHIDGTVKHDMLRFHWTMANKQYELITQP